MEARRGRWRGGAAALVLVAAASLRLGGGDASAGPGFVTATLPNPAYAGADTEPSLRLGRDGTAYVGGIRGFPRGVDIWRVGPGGAPVTYLGSPDSPAPSSVCCAGLGGGDMDLGVADDGTVAYTSLWLGSLTVGRSSDGGRSFVSQPFGSPVVGDDRPWLATDGAAMYLSFHDILTGNIDVERSPAGPQAGLVYAPTRPVLSPGDAALGDNQLGDLLADHLHPGLLYQVYTATPTASLGVNGGTNAGQSIVRMGVSSDGGSSWTQHVVLTGPPTAGYASVFPTAALDHAGNVYVAVSDNTASWCWRAPTGGRPGGARSGSTRRRAAR